MSVGFLENFLEALDGNTFEKPVLFGYSYADSRSL
jgi:hypothetical protein